MATEHQTRLATFLRGVADLDRVNLEANARAMGLTVERVFQGINAERRRRASLTKVAANAQGDAG